MYFLKHGIIKGIKPQCQSPSLFPCHRLHESFFNNLVGSIIISHHQGYQRHATMSKGFMTTSRSSSWPLLSRIQGHHHYNEPIPCPSSGPHAMCVCVRKLLQLSAMGFKLYKGHHQTCSHHQACSGSKDCQTTYFKNFIKGKVTIYHHGINIKQSMHHVFLEACHHQQGLV